MYCPECGSDDIELSAEENFGHQPPEAVAVTLKCWDCQAEYVRLISPPDFFFLAEKIQ